MDLGILQILSDRLRFNESVHMAWPTMALVAIFWCMLFWTPSSGVTYISF
jgi:hypothetical protein